MHRTGAAFCLLYEQGIKATLHLEQTYYAFTLKDSQMRRVTYEILSDRQITRTVVHLNAEESVPEATGALSTNAALAASEKAIGGV